MRSTLANAPLEQVQFETKAGRDFYNCFRALQEQSGLLVPPRRALNLLAAKSFLPYLFIEEWVDADTLIMRLIGTVIVSRNGTDGTGRNVYELMGPEMKQPAQEHVRRLLNTPCGSRLKCTEVYESKSIVTEMVTLPFATNEGEPRFAIGTSAEIDLQDLAARGHSTLQFGEVLELSYLDIGAGV